MQTAYRNAAAFTAACFMAFATILPLVHIPADIDPAPQAAAFAQDAPQRA